METILLTAGIFAYLSIGAFMSACVAEFTGWKWDIVEYLEYQFVGLLLSLVLWPAILPIAIVALFYWLGTHLVKWCKGIKK